VEASPSDNLYVSDLPGNTTEESLRSMFGPGVTQCRVLTSKTPGQGSCVALVRFSSVKEAILVRETLNGAIPPGQQRPVTIRFCGKPDTAKPAVGGGATQGSTPSYTKAVIAAAARQSPYGGGCGNKSSQATVDGPQPNDNLYVTGLPAGIDHESLRGLFGQYGQVTQCKVLPSPNEGQPAHALVRFTSTEEAAAVKKSLTGYALEGVNEPLIIEFALQKPRYNDGQGYDDSRGGSWVSKSEEDEGGCFDKGKGKGKASNNLGQFTPPWGGMDRILQGFQEAQCLPGHMLGNEDNCLFISGLPKDCDDVHLYRLLAPFGAITPTGVKAMKYPDGTCKGFGFVNFVEASCVQAAAMMLHGTQLPDGSKLSVVPKKTKKGAGKGDKGDSMKGTDMSVRNARGTA